MSQPNIDIQFRQFGDNLQGYRGQPSQSHPTAHNHLSDPLLTTPIIPFSSSSYDPYAPSGAIEHPHRVNEDSSLFTGSSLAPHASWSGGVQSISQPEPTGLQLAASGTPASLAEAPPMRYFHADLPVLNIDQYDGGRYSRRPASKANPKPNATAAHVGNAPNPRKRGRKPVDHGQREPTEETKRSRGRPRLETKDQTPSERRRTQIRLAQRAYRNRKENAITDLQAKIDDLKDVNNEINSAYQNLFDYASQRGLLAQAPEFRQQLQRLQTLIKQTQEQDTLKFSDQGSPEGNSDEGVHEVQRTEDTTVLNEEPATTLPESQAEHLWGGLQVSHEPVLQQDIPTEASTLDPTLNNPQAQQYEIVTAPTHDNASFGIYPLVETTFSTAAHSWAEHPWNRLTGPRTMAFHEWAFARRLHRHCVERASALINMPNPPPTRMSRVFGFVMLFETVDEIRSRTMATLNRVREEPLNYWEYPFHRLGGSGTHFDGPSSLSGSSTYQSSGFGTGPFNERTTRVRDTLMGVSQYINMNGWEGTWFDSGEVETYLAQNGVIIPTAADVHTVEIQPGAFSDVQAQPQIQLMQTIPPNTAPILHGSQSFTPGMSGDVPSAMGVPTFSAGPNSAAANPGLIPATQDGAWPPVSVTSSLYGGISTTDGGVPAFTGFDNMAANVFPNSQSHMFSHYEPAPSKRVMLDVNKFIGEMISHATCLGRAPAFRPKDIVTSFWSAVIPD
ncbi:hypothetical protein F4804DRAFT_47465 [Jackrogersella minutella]|nr:hypothetical protein F4804DRAFT_47465 [Jackrogersella minutella]